MLGLIGKKVGMTQVFDESGVLTPVTVISFEENVIVNERTVEKDGYTAHIVGSVNVKENKVKKAYAGQFADGISPKKQLMEFRDSDLEIGKGESFGVEVFENIQYVDVIGTSKGKGYQGVMKRHGFGGGRKTHGSKFHRGLGGTGMAAWPSKVMKGTKMPGRMGGVKSTVQNLEVVKVDTEKQVLLVKGAVPGTRNGLVVVRDAKKR